jgi:hypothetical protein
MTRRDTYMNGSARPYYPQTPQIEAAKHLALVARRFTQERASAHEVEEAIAIWRGSLAAEERAERAEAERDEALHRAEAHHTEIECAICMEARQERLALRAEGDRLRAVLRLKMDEYKPHDPGYCPACDAARAALGDADVREDK